MTELARKEYMREWRAKNKAQIRAYEKAYWAAHPDQYKAKEKRHSEKRKPQVKIYKKAYRLKHLEECRRKNSEWQKRSKHHCRDYLKRYYKAHADTIRQKSKAWYRNNPGKHSVHIIKRRRKTAECPPQEVAIINQWMREVRSKPFARCHWCGTKVSGSEIHFDHVIALARGGSHSIGNLCASCQDCNMEKHSRAITDWIVGGQMFLL